MADVWIKMRVSLHEHPKVVRIAYALASALHADKCPHSVRIASVVGFLHRTWALADGVTTDGVLDGYTPDALDAVVGLPGWTEALVGVGWARVSGSTIELCGYSAHNGTTAKRRGKEAERKRSVRKMSASDADEKRAPSSSLSSSREGMQGERSDPAPADPPPSAPCDDVPPQDMPHWHRVVTALVARLISSSAGGGGLDGRRQWAYHRRLGDALGLVLARYPAQADEAAARFGELLERRLADHDPRDRKAIASLHGWLMGESGADLVPMLRRECGAPAAAIGGAP